MCTTRPILGEENVHCCTAVKVELNIQSRVDTTLSGTQRFCGSHLLVVQRIEKLL